MRCYAYSECNNYGEQCFNSPPLPTSLSKQMTVRCRYDENWWTDRVKVSEENHDSKIHFFYSHVPQTSFKISKYSAGYL